VSVSRLFRHHPVLRVLICLRDHLLVPPSGFLYEIFHVIGTW